MMHFFSTGYFRRSFGSRRSSGYRRDGYTQGRVKRAEHANPTGADGKVTVCHICGSRLHWMRECPNSEPFSVNSGRGNEVGFTRDEEVHITLMTEHIESHDEIDKLFGRDYWVYDFRLGVFEDSVW